MGKIIRREPVCESCGASIPSYSCEDELDCIQNNTCKGCGMLVCQSCVDVFDHQGEGLHGIGDPAEAVRELRKQVENLETTQKSVHHILEVLEEMVKLAKCS